ncbi:hypothetical protein MUK42_35695 [Musa troglodytarum]|uniref:Uncharacterized protein n=1 Tax=Musa troglodytarum TaxID=320322 RepID=A0A9E7FSG8_9LILI|nr:hypothetical protein MUK42_35695 [Musa troglodytarum]
MATSQHHGVITAQVQRRKPTDVNGMALAEEGMHKFELRTQGEAAQSLDGTRSNHSTIVAARH